MKVSDEGRKYSQRVLNAYRKLKNIDQSHMDYIEINRLNETISDIRSKLLSFGYNMDKEG